MSPKREGQPLWKDPYSGMISSCPRELLMMHLDQNDFPGTIFFTIAGAFS